MESDIEIYGHYSDCHFSLLNSIEPPKSGDVEVCGWSDMFFMDLFLMITTTENCVET